MLKVLILTTNYWPEPTGIAVYTTDLAEFLQGEDLQVSVLTSLPHYPWWKIPSEFAHLTEGVSQHQSVKVIRARHLIPQKMNALVRIRFEGSLWWNLRRVSRRVVGNDFDAVIACIPTVAAGIVGKKVAKKMGVPFGLIIQDLSGAGAKQSGIKGGALISKFAIALESSILKAANAIVVVSPAMLDVILGLGIEATQVTQIANYSARNIENLNRDSARDRFGWASDDFVVIHTGNMGSKQDLENVVKSAKLLGRAINIKIYLVGHGNQEVKLKRLCESIENIDVLPAVTEDQYSALLSAADLLLVNERSTQLEMSLPSKLTSYLFSGRPVIAAVPSKGATWNFLEGIAELVEAGNPKLLAKSIQDLRQNKDKRDKLANKGLEFARKNLEAEIGRKKYLDWVNRLIEFKRGQV